MMKRILLSMAVVWTAVSPVQALGTVTLEILPPTSYVRQSGEPAAQVLQVLSDFGGPAVLRVTNGSLENSAVELVSSSVITLNGQTVVGPSEFNQQVRYVEKVIVLRPGANTLAVELRGKPGGAISCNIVQPVTNVRVIPASLSLGEPGTTAGLTVLGSLGDGTPVDISSSRYGTTYSSDAPGIASVSADGLVTAVGLGRTNVTVRTGDFVATVPVVVKGSPPVVSNLQLAHAALPLPRELEEFPQTITFDFTDPNADVATLNVTLAGPAGVVRSRSEHVSFPEAEASGSASQKFLFDSSSAAGLYTIRIEMLDAMGNSSGVHAAAFAVDPNAARFLEITGMTPGTGTPGETITIRGWGFFEGHPGEHEVRFQGSASAEILSVTATQIDVMVPTGALTGPITVENPAGRAASPAPFAVPHIIEIRPAGSRLLTGQTADFAVVQNGARSAGVTCTLDGQTAPGPERGALTVYPGGFTYGAPATPPSGGHVSIRCESVADPGVYAAVDVDVIAPPPPPGGAVVEADQGAVIESVQGDVTLSVPPGALPSDTHITVEQLDPDDVPWSWDARKLLAAVRLEPSGAAFSAPATVRLPLRNWEQPGTNLPLFTRNEATGEVIDTGKTAIVDESGLAGTASIDHFSTYLLAQQYSPADVTVNASVMNVLEHPEHAPSGYWDYVQYGLHTPPEMPLLEGLSVPIILQRTGGPVAGVIGPFAAPWLLKASVNIPSSSVGPLMLASADGWQLGTVLNLGVLPDCGAGQTRAGELTITYTKVGATQTLVRPFRIQCLDELVFDGTTPPAFVPAGAIDSGQYYDYRDLRVIRYSTRVHVMLMNPTVAYRFSRIDIGAGGVLTYYKYAPPAGIDRPFTIEVTGDVRVAGTIFLGGLTGFNGGDGGTRCGDCGGAGAPGAALNSGRGGYGGPFTLLEWSPIPCDQGMYFQRGGLWLSYCEGGQKGGTPAFQTYGGGAGGKVWEKGSILALVLDIGSFLLNGVACVSGGVGACAGAAQDAAEIYGDADAIANNSSNAIRASGKGGVNRAWNAPLDVAYFNPPAAGSGGGGAGNVDIPLADDKGGGAGGGGGGAAANLKLAVGGRLTIETGGKIDGTGGNGGGGGSAEDGEAAPGGGGAGGSGSAVHVIALRGVRNYGLITARGGLGGRSGEIDVDGDTVLVDTSFGTRGNDGRLRVDGSFVGSNPMTMSRYQGPVITPRVAASSGIQLTQSGAIQSVNGLSVNAGAYGQSYAILTPPSDFDTSGLKTVSVRIRNRYTDQGAVKETDVALDHPWQKGYAFYFPGVPAPVITTFTATPSTVTAGDYVVLAYSFANGTGVIDQSIGQVTSGGTTGINAYATRTYTLTVTNTAGVRVTAQATVTVMPAPLITRFTATPATIAAGSTATLAYSFTNGAGIVDQAVGSVTSGGTTAIRPSSTTTYTLTVTNAMGRSVSSQATVTVVPAPVITAFTATPATVSPGGTSRLTATFTGGTGMVSPGNLPLTSGGSVDVTPVVATTYTLTVTPLVGPPVTRSVTVMVDPGLAGMWTETGGMNAPRRDHTATLLHDGRVLFVGWLTQEAEVYDPSTGLFTSVGQTRERHGWLVTATRLQDGRVFIAGGSWAPSSAEIFDPGTNTFTSAASLNAGRFAHTATLLSDGRVLVVGGYMQLADGPQSLTSTEIYDPGTNTFAPGPSLNTDRAAHGATLLPDRRVLVAGGARTTIPGYSTELASAEIYDPEAGSFSLTAPMSEGHTLWWTGLPVLNDGTALIAEGSTVEVFDPATATFTTAASMQVARRAHTATLLPSGLVLLAGGYVWDAGANGNVVVATAELYDPFTRTFTPGASMQSPRQQHTATLLPDGRVLVAGGYWNAENIAVAAAELFWRQ